MPHIRIFLQHILMLLLLFAEFSVVIGVTPFPAEHKVRVEVQWPAVATTKRFEDEQEYEDLLLMTTANKLQYRCVLPTIHPGPEEHTLKSYKGPTPLELLKPLFSKYLCYFRLETYWSYELCHGHYFRQFHEENTARGRVVQEFFLGKYDASATTGENSSIGRESTSLTKDLPTVRVDDAELPYYVVSMSDGTHCGLRDQPRYTRVLYVCHPRGNNGIYSFKETSTCEYEVIVLTTALCKHPSFRIDYFMESVVNCYPLPGSPPHPRMMVHRDSSAKSSMDTDPKKSNVYKPDIELDEDVSGVHIPDIDDPAIYKTKKATVTSKTKITPHDAPHDQKLMDDVLNGDYCLHGGSGWWRYEFCYGKRIQQYHENPGGVTTYILLGKWNVDKHLEWIEKHPNRKIKKGKIPNQISHFYSDGDFCEETKKPRQLEVKLKCKESPGHPDTVTLYFSEPYTCEYIITVESPVFCSLIELADENGLTPNIRK